MPLSPSRIATLHMAATPPHEVVAFVIDVLQDLKKIDAKSKLGPWRFQVTYDLDYLVKGPKMKTDVWRGRELAGVPHAAVSIRGLCDPGNKWGVREDWAGNHVTFKISADGKSVYSWREAGPATADELADKYIRFALSGEDSAIRSAIAMRGQERLKADPAYQQDRADGQRRLEEDDAKRSDATKAERARQEREQAEAKAKARETERLKSLDVITVAGVLRTMGLPAPTHRSNQGIDQADVGVGYLTVVNDERGSVHWSIRDVFQSSVGEGRVPYGATAEETARDIARAVKDAVAKHRVPEAPGEDWVVFQLCGSREEALTQARLLGTSYIRKYDPESEDITRGAKLVR